MSSGTRQAEIAEAAVIACEKLLAALPTLLDDAALENVRDWLDERQILQDGQEDPGAVLSDGLALELAIAARFRRMSEILKQAQAEGT